MDTKSQARSGNEVEGLVESICTKMFFSDFTVRNPTFSKNDGIQKEAADLLVPFGKYLLAFQVKSKLEKKNVNEKTDVDFNRISKTVREAINQLKTIKRIVNNKWVVKLTTVKGYEIPFSSSDFEETIGIVILDLIGEEGFPEEERTGFINSYTFDHGMPIHVFMRDEFEALSSELDTVPDFIEFLDKRKLLLEKGLLFPVSILDFLAFYKTNPDTVDNAIERNINLFLEEGLWQDYQKTLNNVINHRNKLNEPSYIIDKIIDFLHTSVGFNVPGDISKELGLSGHGSLEGYLTIAIELASLTRLERRMLGEKFSESMNRAETKDFSFSMIFKENEESAILVLAMKGRRSDRQSRLMHLCAMAYCYMKAKKIIGIASEPLSTPFRSYDAIGLKDVDFKNREELAEEAKKYFSRPYKPNFSEYQGKK